MKILLVHKDIISETGGAEKMCCFFANNFAERGHDVEIVAMEDLEGSVIYPLDSRVKLINLFDPKIPQLYLKPVIRYEGTNPIKWFCSKYLREKAKFYNKKAYKKAGGREEEVFKYNLRNRAKVWHDYITKSSPDIIIVMKLNYVFEITFEQKYHVPIVFSSNGRPDDDYKDISIKRPTFLSEYLQNSYKYLSGCQILFDSYRNLLPKNFSGKVFTIPNPVYPIEDNDIVFHRNDKERFVLAHIARLDDNCKQQSVSIEIFSRFAKKYPKWDLHFWGTGEDESILREKIISLGLEDRIFLKGFTKNPIEKFKDSDIFIFPSKFEGFGLALAEAMSVGLPSVGFESCTGVNEIIEHDKNGFLAKDIADMQNLVEKLMKDSELRNRLGKQANKDMRKYDPKLIADKWEELVNYVRK